MTTTMIRPVNPVILGQLYAFASEETVKKLLFSVVFVSAAAIIALLICRYTPKKCESKRRTLVYLCITAVISAVMFFSCSGLLAAIRGTAMLLILLYASQSDIKTREVDDYVSVMLLLTAFIGIETRDIPAMLMGAIFTAVPMLIVTVASKNGGVGGADIKLTAACGFILGVKSGIAGLTAGLLLAVICNTVIGKAKKKKVQGFPLVPYLAVGFTAAYFIT